MDDFTQADRERVLELLLSQERVVSLIYAKTFPINPSITHKGAPMDNNANASSNLANEFGNLLDGTDYPPSPTNGGNNDRPSTTGALQQGLSGGNGGNVGGGSSSTSNNNNNNTSTAGGAGNNAKGGGGVSLPPVSNQRGISR